MSKNVNINCKYTNEDKKNHEDNEEKIFLDRKKRQEEFLERVESKLRRSEKDIWFINNEDHPHKEGLSKGIIK